MNHNAEYANALHRVASRRFGQRKTAGVTHTRGYHQFTEKDKAEMGAFQSLDFTITDNELLREYDKMVSKYDHMLKTFGKWVICFAIGIFTGLVAFGLKKVVENLQEIKFQLADYYIHMNYFFLPLLIFSSINVVFVAVSVTIILLVGPLAGGSGIPEVKGYLNGVRIPNSLNIKTLIGKLLSLVLSYSSGLFLGPEGPMVHIGAMVGAAVGQAKSKTFAWYPKILWKYHNDRDRRDFITSGVGAGIAAAFGAPIGGVLFSIEEACSFWTRQVTWRTFFSCLVATITVNIFLQGFNMQMHDYGLLTFGFSRNYLYRYLELIPFTLLGVTGGLLGAFYVHLALRVIRWRDEHLRNSKAHRLVDALLVILFTSVLCFTLGSVMPCRQDSMVVIPDSAVCDNNVRSDKMVQMYCKPGEYSDMGSLVFVPPDAALNLLYSRSRHVFSLTTLALYAFFFFFLTLITTSGLWVASGIFIPTMLVGGAIGRLAGEIVSMIFPHVVPQIDPSIYSMVGSAALMAGTTRVTISLVVIMMELTEGTQYLLPVILSVMVAKWVGDIFNESVYEHLIELKCIPFLPTQPPRSKVLCTATEIMASDIVTFSPVEKVSNLVNVLSGNTHNGFPIIDVLQDERKATLQGVILRSHIITLLVHKIFTERPPTNMSLDYTSFYESATRVLSEVNVINDNNDDVSNRGSVTGAVGGIGQRLSYAEFTQSVARAHPPVDQLRFTQAELDMYVDLRPYMNLSPSIVLPHACFAEVYRIFRTLGLRHLVVVDRSNVVVGMITRKDLL